MNNNNKQKRILVVVDEDGNYSVYVKPKGAPITEQEEKILQILGDVRVNHWYQIEAFNLLYCWSDLHEDVFSTNVADEDLLKVFHSICGKAAHVPIKPWNWSKHNENKCSVAQMTEEEHCVVYTMQSWG